MSGVACFICDDNETPKIDKKGRFGELLTDEQLFLAFEEYLRNEFSDENLHFYRDSIKLSDLSATTQPNELRSLALQLTHKYLGFVSLNQLITYFSTPIRAIPKWDQKVMPFLMHFYWSLFFFWSTNRAGAEPRVLNIPERMVDDINSGLHAKKFDPDLFQAARNDIESVLKTKYIAFSEI
jgi:hypothetical protein